VALVLTTNNLVPVHSFEVLIQPLIPFSAISMDPFVVNMHEKSGLFDQVTKNGVHIYEASNELVAWMGEVGITKGDLPMAGSSVGFDRSFLKRHMPEVESMFHYRNIDVSTVKELAKCWGGEMPRRVGAAAHRAHDDIMASISELQHYRDTGFLGAAAGPPPPVPATKTDKRDIGHWCVVTDAYRPTAIAWEEPELPFPK